MKPSRTALWILTAWLLSGTAVTVLQFWFGEESSSQPLTTLTLIWHAIAACLLTLAILDALLRLKPCPLQISRQVPENVALDHWTDVILSLQNCSRRPLQLEIFDHFPSIAKERNAHRLVKLAAQARDTISYEIRATRRGNWRFTQVDVQLLSPLKLWQFRYQLPCTNEILVYPNFSTLTFFKLLSMKQQTRQMGIRFQPRRGEGLEFHQLREFRQGDSLRQIDWNASARLHKPISREYQDETDQQIIFLLDCGRNLRSQDQELGQFDHALNAVLLLSQVALRQGDSVGLMSFSGAECWVPPLKGTVQIATLLNRIYDLQSTQRVSDYMSAAQRFRQLRNKRSLVIIITAVREEYATELQPAIQLLQDHHLVILANLEEPILQQTEQNQVTNFEQALAYCGVHQHLLRQQRIRQQLEQQGIKCINSRPSDLAISLVNQYHDIKRKGLL